MSATVRSPGAISPEIRLVRIRRDIVCRGALIGVHVAAGGRQRARHRDSERCRIGQDVIVDTCDIRRDEFDTRGCQIVPECMIVDGARLDEHGVVRSSGCGRGCRIQGRRIRHKNVSSSRVPKLGHLACRLSRYGKELGYVLWVHDIAGRRALGNRRGLQIVAAGPKGVDRIRISNPAGARQIGRDLRLRRQNVAALRHYARTADSIIVAADAGRVGRRRRSSKPVRENLCPAGIWIRRPRSRTGRRETELGAAQRFVQEPTTVGQAVSEKERLRKILRARRRCNQRDDDRQPPLGAPHSKSPKNQFILISGP